MPRHLRIQLSGLHYHVIARCNNREFLLQNDEDFLHYLSVLRQVQKKHGFKLFNYELMNSHVHLFLQPSPAFPLSKTMQKIHWTYSLEYNRRKNRKAHFWMQHYQAIPVELDLYALSLMRYMNRNPIRAGMIREVGDWRWSGYHFYARAEPNSLLEYHPAYLALSRDEFHRQKYYTDFVKTILPGEAGLHMKFSKARYIGSDRFGQKIKKCFGD